MRYAIASGVAALIAIATIVAVVMRPDPPPEQVRGLANIDGYKLGSSPNELTVLASWNDRDHLDSSAVRETATEIVVTVEIMRKVGKPGNDSATEHELEFVLNRPVGKRIVVTSDRQQVPLWRS